MCNENPFIITVWSGSPNGLWVCKWSKDAREHQSPDLKLGWEIVQKITMIGQKKPFFKESSNPSNFFGFWSWVSGWVGEKCGGEQLKPSKTRFPAQRSLPWGYPKLKTWTRSKIVGHFFFCGLVRYLGIWYCRRVRFEGIWYCRRVEVGSAARETLFLKVSGRLNIFRPPIHSPNSKN